MAGDDSNSNPLTETHHSDSLASCRDVLAFIQLAFEEHNEEVILNQQARQGLLILLGWLTKTIGP